MNKSLDKAVKCLKKGGIVIFPTDTAFGIGTRIDNKESVKKLFKIRRRAENKAVPVLVASIEMARDYVDEVTPQVEKLMKKHWPGGLTIVLKCKTEMVPELVRGGGETIGIRIPGNSTTRNMIKNVGVPVLAPSANFSGETTPFKKSDLNPELVKIVDFVLNGRCSVKKPSTVIDVTGSEVKIIRKGAVTI